MPITPADVRTKGEAFADILAAVTRLTPVEWDDPIPGYVRRTLANADAVEIFVVLWNWIETKVASGTLTAQDAEAVKAALARLE